MTWKERVGFTVPNISIDSQVCMAALVRNSKSVIERGKKEKKQIWCCIKSEEFKACSILKTVKLAGVLFWALDQAESWNIRTRGHKPTRSVQPAFYFVWSLKTAPVKCDEL